MDALTDWIPFLTVAGSVVGSLIIAWWQRGKTKADTAQGISGAFDTLVDNLQSENGRMRERMQELEAKVDGLATRVDEVEDENGRLLAGIKRLIAQLRRHNIEPEWTPDEGTTSNKPKRRRRM